MKIGTFSLSEVTLGKHNIKDSRLDEVEKIVKPKKKTYIQVEIIGEDSLLDADAILTRKESKTDLVLKDLEFVEIRLGRVEQDSEKTLLEKLKTALEKEEFISGIDLNPEEKKLISAYGLLTYKPIVMLEANDLTGLDNLWVGILQKSGYLSFFTAGEKETRAWLMRQGTCAWEAAGTIHSDIQKGFIRAEVISFADFINAGGETKAKQAGKMRLEPKEYIMQDADIVNFRFNK